MHLKAGTTLLSVASMSDADDWMMDGFTRIDGFSTEPVVLDFSPSECYMAVTTIALGIIIGILLIGNRRF